MLDIRLCKSRWSEARELIAAAHESNQPQWVVRKEVFYAGATATYRLSFPGSTAFSEDALCHPVVHPEVLSNPMDTLRSSRGHPFGLLHSFTQLSRWHQWVWCCSNDFFRNSKTICIRVTSLYSIRLEEKINESDSRATSNKHRTGRF